MSQCPHTDDAFGGGGGIAGTIGESDSASDGPGSASWAATGATFSIGAGFTGGVVLVQAFTTAIQDPVQHNPNAQIRLNIDGTTYTPSQGAEGSAAVPSLLNIAIHKIISLAAGAHTITVEFADGSSATGHAYLQNTHLTVLY